MSKVDFTKPVRVVHQNASESIPCDEIAWIENRAVIKFRNRSGTTLIRFVDDDGTLWCSKDDESIYSLRNVVDVQPVDWSQGVLDNPLKVPWKAVNINNNCGGCYIKCGDKDFYIYSQHPHLIEPTIIDPNRYQYDNQWPIPASALAKLAEMTKDELPEGVELKNTNTIKQDGAYCFIDGELAGFICNGSNIEIDETVIRASKTASCKHRRADTATYTWIDLVRIRDEHRANRKAEIKPTIQYGMIYVTTDVDEYGRGKWRCDESGKTDYWCYIDKEWRGYSKTFKNKQKFLEAVESGTLVLANEQTDQSILRVGASNCTVTTSGLAAEVGAR